MTSKELQQLIEDCDYPTRSYSGRSMYGKECLAFTLDSGQSPMAAVADIMAYAAEDIEGDTVEHCRAAFEKARSDSMGHGMVIYFPHLDYAKDEDNDH